MCVCVRACVRSRARVCVCYFRSMSISSELQRSRVRNAAHSNTFSEGRTTTWKRRQQNERRRIDWYGLKRSSVYYCLSCRVASPVFFCTEAELVSAKTNQRFGLSSCLVLLRILPVSFTRSEQCSKLSGECYLPLPPPPLLTIIMCLKAYSM